MKQTAKKILKYLVILALLVGAGFLVVAIFFPTPKADEAYNCLYAISQDESWEKVLKSNDDIFDIMENVDRNDTNFDWTLFDKNKQKFEISNTIYQTLFKINDVCCTNLVFAKSNNSYNTQTKNLKKQNQDFSKVLQEYTDYIDQYFNTFATQSKTSTPSKEGVVPYTNALLTLNQKLIKSFTKLLDIATKILPDQNQTFENNSFVQAKLSNLICWTDAYANNFENLDTNFVDCYQALALTLDINHTTQNILDQQSQHFVLTTNNTSLDTFYDFVATSNIQKYKQDLAEQQNQTELENITFLCSYLGFLI